MPGYQNRLIIVIPIPILFSSLILCRTLISFRGVFSFTHQTLFPTFPIHSFIHSSWSLSIQLILFLIQVSIFFPCMITKSRAETERVIANFKNSDKQIRLALVLISPPFLIIHPHEWIETSVLSSLSLLASFSSWKDTSYSKKSFSSCNLNCTIVRNEFVFHAIET